MTPELFTVGHGTAGQAALTQLLQTAGVTRLVDVRRHPGSRNHPQVAHDRLAQWLPEAGIAYRWDERLGGRRRLPPDSPDLWWQVPAFRAYAHHMRTAPFQKAVADLLAEAVTAPTVIMCSESVWWRCHRRLIADFVVLAAGGTVRHLGHDGRFVDHPVATGARRSDAGSLVYDRA